MFTIENRINGALIGVLYGHNEGHANFDAALAHDICRYTYRYTDIKSGEQISGSVNHSRNDGLRNLVARIYLDMEKDNL